jgi:hypothetical protein
VSVPIPGLDGRETKLRSDEVQLLRDARQELPGGLGVGGTHVVFLPSRKQEFERFDTTLGALGVLGIHAMVIQMPEKVWRATSARLRDCIDKLKNHLRGHGSATKHWQALFDFEMLRSTFDPLFAELEAQSSKAGLPACDHLLLVGCEDGAWVMQAFLSDLDNRGLRPHVDITLVALGSKTDTRIAKAVNAVYPERLPYVKYLSVHGELPARQGEGEGADVEGGAGGGEGGSVDKESEDLAANNWYGYGPEVVEAMSCLTLDGIDQECIISTPSDYEGPTEAWYGAPATMVRWIVKAL